MPTIRELVTTIRQRDGGNAAIRLVLLQPSANVGQRRFELRWNREHIAALV
jgi:hypothetical protein